MEYLIVAATVITLVVLVSVSFDKHTAWRMLPVLLAAFAVRLVVHLAVVRPDAVGYGGDYLGYESISLETAAFWQREGLQFATSVPAERFASVALPCYVFAFVIYLCGGAAPLACTAVVALIACALCIVMYRFARVVGADERAAFVLLVVTAFSPMFLLCTSDTFKDGFNAFLVVGCLYLAVSTARRFDIRKPLMTLSLLWALWNVRAYMVFMCAVPALLGVMGSRGAAFTRALVVSGGLLVAGLFFFGYVDSGGVMETALGQLEFGQSEEARRSYASQGSGVLFDDSGNAWGSLIPKLLYTLLAPFPWTEGSATLQLGKIEMLIWYFMLYSAVRGVRVLWRHDRRVLLILLLFIVPSTIAYATTVANVGLIFRQRIPIVMVTSLLSAVAWSRRRPSADTEETARRPLTRA
ncbi:hypothetical protein [Nonomuraea sp. NEAU-A123]|uniref:hypothetical protein n=1 Tax=Nonomuraea sp. NEAU-A123 TaxID=2839649 RepID=UPI001BE4B82F|nr:hypothetical protein [Nonomuraea sp. NEAU-A123]MBT2231279.1 hypothetical protein [Nonomuraea sp. NEAU-A123]